MRHSTRTMRRGTWAAILAAARSNAAKGLCQTRENSKPNQIKIPPPSFSPPHVVRKTPWFLIIIPRMGLRTRCGRMLIPLPERRGAAQPGGSSYSSRVYPCHRFGTYLVPFFSRIDPYSPFSCFSIPSYLHSLASRAQEQQGDIYTSYLDLSRGGPFRSVGNSGNPDKSGLNPSFGNPARRQESVEDMECVGLRLRTPGPR